MLRENIDKIRTVVKFITNPQHNCGINVLITKTLKKIGLIDSEWIMSPPQDRQPEAGEFWIVDVTSETYQGETRGCLIVTPISPAGEVSYLLPGMYSEQVVDGLLIVVPKNEGPHWILTRKLKNAAMDRLDGEVSAVIVSADGQHFNLPQNTL